MRQFLHRIEYHSHTYACLLCGLTFLLPVLQALGIMEVRTVLATLLGRFWFDLAPSMGKPEQVHKNQTIALTLKMREGLRVVAKPHQEEGGDTGKGPRARAAAVAPAGPLN
jgi:hypothetical protein